MRRSSIGIGSAVAVVIVLLGLGGIAVATAGPSSVTRARLERSLPAAFANVYGQQALLLGHPGVSAASIHARAMCDDGGHNAGPGSTWVCLMAWTDPNVPMPPSGYGKFELNVHSNDCYTAGSPTSLGGFQTITDSRGHTVTNPVFEFDACFDPHSSDRPTGVRFPSALTVTTTSLTPSRTGAGTVDVTCGTGAGGCAGTMTVTTQSGQALGSFTFDLPENSSRALVPPAIPAGAKQVSLSTSYQRGSGPATTTLAVDPA